MATLLSTPITITNTANTVQVTAIVNNVEDGRFEIHYMTILEDGTPYQRGNVTIECPMVEDPISGLEVRDTAPIKALYAEQDAKMATVNVATGVNYTFEEASTEILYAKVLAHLGV